MNIWLGLSKGDIALQLTGNTTEEQIERCEMIEFGAPHRQSSHLYD